MTSSHVPFKYANSSQTPPSRAATQFQLTVHASKDIWRKPGPPKIEVFNAPILYKSFALSFFQRVRVTVSAPWSTLYDQGGLVFILPESSDGTRKWIKSGIEFYKNEVYVSTVVADRWADWSLVQTGLKDGNEVTLEFERNKEEGTLWIYVVDGDKKIPVREVTWILSEGGDDKECWVGVYAAKPTVSAVGTEQGLVVDFKGWELDLI
jgi:regulation of enolase protein 1 (concanavalin A-like superfamily)